MGQLNEAACGRALTSTGKIGISEKLTRAKLARQIVLLDKISAILY